MDNITIINGELAFVCENVANPEGFEEPTYRDVYIDLPEDNGSLFINELAGQRQFSWRGLIKDNIQENRRLLSRVCQPGGLKTVQFELCDGVAVQTEATLRLVNPYSEERSPYIINAVSPDAYFGSQALHSESTGITLRRGGLPIPAAIPAPIGGGSNIALSLINAGNTATKPNFQIRGPGTTFLVKNLDTNESFILDLTLANNEIVTIDTRTNEALKGNQFVFGAIERTPVGQWITMQPGLNRFVFSAISGHSINTRLTVSWRDAWSGF